MKGLKFENSVSHRSPMGSYPLEQLWRAQIMSVLAQFLAETTDYREVASLASHIGADYKGRFLIELIQNAEDQSVVSESSEADHRGARLVIVRTKKLLVIINEGRSFSAKGIKSITSLGLSAKEPEHNLGNKGVGFKAVFEVTEGPEIYSAHESGGSIWDDAATRLRLETDPFLDECFRERIKELIKEVVDADPQLRTRLAKFVQTEDYVSVLLKELKQAAPFKFPKPVGCDFLTGYLGELGLSRKTLERAATVVVLPLLQRESALRALEQALDELTGTEYPASVLLFLEGIEKLWVIDRVRDVRWLMRRKTLDSYKRLPRGARLQRVSTRLTKRSNAAYEAKYAEWWLASRKIGREGDDLSTVDLEEKQIKQAVANLEIANWREVRSAHSAIALPRPYPDKASLAQLGTGGKFCIGLPTRVDTGLPAWVDGPFHGKVSRTDIDFDTQDYNGIILNDAKQLFWDLLSRMKEFEGIAVRREVLLNLEIGHGAFASAVQEDVHLAECEVVMDSYGIAFLKPEALVIPDVDDISFFYEFIVPVVDLAEYGFIIPDKELLTRCRAVLEALSGDSQVTVGMQAYLRRPDGRRSLLEEVAQKYRSYGREHWEPFLTWVTERFSFGDLKDQYILPVGSTDLAAAEDRVFFRPLIVKLQADNSDDESERGDDYGDEIVDDLDESFLEELSFLDENCIQVRMKSRGRRLTDLARRLSPEQGTVLVRNPRRPELINEVLAPFLKDICPIPDQQDKALAVLAQISDWLIDMSESAKTTVHLNAVLIPSIGENGNWVWRASGGMYFASGWLDVDTGRLLEIAYGHREGARLPPWEVFSGMVGSDADRAVWKMRFLTLGVLDKPRLIHYRGRGRSYLKAGWDYQLSVADSSHCPIEQARPYWNSYLQRLTNRPTEVKSGQPYFIRDPIWIDGLETEAARAAIVKLILRNADRYTGSTEISVAREHGVDSVSFPALWVHAIKEQQWPILPTNLGDLSPEKSWRLPDDMQRRSFVRDGLIAYVTPPYNQGSTLLSHLGVYSPSDVPIGRIVRELQNLAESLDEVLAEKRRSTEAFVHALYAWLQDRCDNTGDPAGQLAYITERPIPMIQGGQIRAVDLGGDARVLLDDDPSRSPYVIGIENIGQLPLRDGKPFKALFKGLRSVLGEDRVLRASEASIDIGFLADLEMKKVGYLEYLLAEGTGDHQNVRRNLGALIAYGRPQQPMDPQKKEFKDTWKRLQETRLVRGYFRDRERTGAVFDPRADDGPSLFVPIEYDHDQILGAGWQLVGPAHRDVWEAYVGRVRAGDSHVFFQERHITERDWDELGAVIGTSLGQQMHAFRPVLLALRRRIRPELDVESFLHELEMQGADPRVVATWVSADLTHFRNSLQEAALFSSDERMVDILRSFHLEVAEWQRARQDLGLAPVVFRDTEDAFRMAQTVVIAFLRASVAREQSPSEALNRFRQLLERLRVTACPKVVREQPENETVPVQAVITEFQAVLAENPTGMEKEFIVDRLNNLDHIQTIEELADQRVAQREINLYQHEAQAQRETGAQSAVCDILNVAKSLAIALDEVIDLEAIEHEASLVHWTTGWWANRFAALRNLRVLLKNSAPRTVTNLESVKVFRNPCRSWRDLWRKFPELGELPKDERPIRPHRKRILLGAEIIESDFEHIISQGDAGVLGQALLSAIDQNLDPVILAGRLREQVPPPQKRKSGGNGRGGGGGGG